MLMRGSFSEGFLVELKSEKQVEVHEEQERKGRRGAPSRGTRATKALGQRPGHLRRTERGGHDWNMVWAQGQVRLDR